MTALTPISPSNRPVAVFSNGYYRQAPKSVLVAGLDAGVGSAVLSADTSRYEFPGDRTYERYVSNRFGGASNG